jgi:cytosine/adenosine deaminase-related metal-dependent hydrolase
MATAGGAAALLAAGSLGAIAPGMRADLVLYDLRTPTLAPLNDPVQQLVFAERGRSVRTVMIDGRIVYDDGTFPTIDAEAVIGDVIALRGRQRTRNRRLSH